MPDGIPIRLKRAKNYLNKNDQELKKISEYVLDYGEPIYLKDIGLLLVGDGVSTVKELISLHENFANANNTNLYRNARFQYQESEGSPAVWKDKDIPVATSNTTIANTKFVKDAIYDFAKNSIILENDSSPAKDKTVTKFVYDTTNNQLKVKFEPIEITYDQVQDGDTNKKPLPSTEIPKMDGAGSYGSSTNYSREDHVHPSDTSRAPLVSPAFTGSPTSTTPDSSDNSTKIATTAFVRAAATAGYLKEPKTANATDTIYVTGVKEANGSLYYNTAGSKNSSGVKINCATGALMGAAWNDFAEYRKCKGEPGDVVCEVGDGSLKISCKDMQAGAAIISDTYGMVIGPEGKDYQPICVAGRVLAKYSGDLKEYLPGTAVCANDRGMVRVMTREEICYYPDRILGYISEIPSYKKWNNIEVNNRIWIKIK